MEGGRSCSDGEKVTNLGQRRAMIPCRFSALMRADMFTSGMWDKSPFVFMSLGCLHCPR